MATVSISAIIGENGLIKKAQEAKQHQSNAIAMEESEMDKLAEEYANLMEEDKTIIPEEPVVTITFTIENVTYTAEENMTWAEWVNSKYNTANLLVSKGDLISEDINASTGGGVGELGTHVVKKDETIISDQKYNYFYNYITYME